MLQLDGQIDEVHIETMPRRVHHLCMWSVGVIGLALFKFTGNICDDIPVKSWQKHCDWNSIEDKWEEAGLGSEDELAAMMMGKWYTETQV